MDVKKLIEEVLIDLGNNKSLTDVSGYKDEELPEYRKSRAADIKANYMAPQGLGALHMPNQRNNIDIR